MNQAEQLNKILQEQARVVFNLLSKRGRKAFFPKAGILGQTAEAKGATYNATIGQAFEDNGTPIVLDTLRGELPKKFFLYTSSYGYKKLRECWKTFVKFKNGVHKAPISMPVVTNGLTHALHIAYKLFVDEDDTIILPDLFWGNYKLVFEGVKFDTFPYFVDGGFNLAGFKEKLSTPSKKIVLLNSPNNPSGYTPTNDEAVEIVKIIKASAEAGNEVLVIVDDAYFRLVYEEGIFTESLFALLADLHKNVVAVKVDGLTKEAFAWGLRVGFLTYAWKGATLQTLEVLEDKTAGLVRGTISNVSTISQHIAVKALRSLGYATQRAEKVELLKKRYQTVKNVLEDHQEYKEYFEALPFNSGYFMCVKLKKGNAQEIRKTLVTEYSTGLIAIGDDLLRIAYSSIGAGKLKNVFENVYKACKELHPQPL